MKEWEGRDLIALHFFYVPVTRETSRLIFSVKSAFLDKSTLKGKLLSALNPTWKDHITRSTVLDGDAIFLHRQTIDILNGASPVRSCDSAAQMLISGIPSAIHCMACTQACGLLCQLDSACDETRVESDAATVDRACKTSGQA